MSDSRSRLASRPWSWSGAPSIAAVETITARPPQELGRGPQTRGRELVPAGGTFIFGNDPDRDWERFGAEDPYYAILNTEAYRRHRLDDASIDEIFRSGEACIEGFLRFAEQSFGPLPRRSALEFGCGVGRLLVPLSARFDSVTGIDVSPSMLREAEIHCAVQENIRLLQADDGLSGVSAHFDFILSYLVLQHIPVRRGELVLRGILEHLNPGGVAALHFTLGRSSSRTRHALHILRRNCLPLHYVANLLSNMRWNEPLMQSNLYRLERIIGLAVDGGVGQMAMQPVQHDDHRGVMLYLRRVPGVASSGATAVMD